MNFMEYSTSAARFYDIIYQSKRSGKDHAFFMSRITQTEGKILEIGTGTGRFFVDALKAGADIYGIDVSPRMLDVLLEKIGEEERDRIKLEDGRTFKSELSFQLILAPFRVIQHMETVEYQLALLSNVHHHLEQGGYFIFDAFIPNIHMLANPLKDHVDFDGYYEEGKRLIRKVSVYPDYIHQINKVEMQYLWEEQKGEWKDERWTFNMRYFYLYELAHLLQISPFTTFKIYGGYKYEPLTNESRDFVVIAQK